MPSLSRLTGLAAALSLLAACTTSPAPKKVVPPAAVNATPAPVPKFNIAAGELDTWNAIGQLLVRMDGVTYHGRAQKLGLYDVAYRGERFLLITHALWLSEEIKVTTTEVRATLQDGKPNTNAPAIELLGLLEKRLPAELVRIASDKKKPAAKKAVVKKKTTKPAVRR